MRHYQQHVHEIISAIANQYNSEQKYDAQSKRN
jgi:hypothetical protein